MSRRRVVFEVGSYYEPGHVRAEVVGENERGRVWNLAFGSRPTVIHEIEGGDLRALLEALHMLDRIAELS